MKIVFQIFGFVRKGADYLSKATKITKSVDVVSRHVKAMVDDLEKIWDKDLQKELKKEGK